MGSITVGRLLAVQMMATKINTSIGRLNRAMGTEDGQTKTKIITLPGGQMPSTHQDFTPNKVKGFIGNVCDRYVQMYTTTKLN